jgi:hypothetical protein
LWRHREATLLALLGAITAELALRLALAGAAAALSADRPRGLAAAAGRATLILASGFGSALLLGACTRAAALCRYGGGRARDGLRRVPALLAVSLLELLLLGTLASALVLGGLRLLPYYGTVTQRAACATALLAPLLPAALLTFAVARVAQGLVARGLPLGLALLYGCDFTLRRLPSLTRLGLSAVGVTSPLLLAALLAPALLRPAALALASLWSYAALIRLVGADARLAHG